MHDRTKEEKLVPHSAIQLLKNNDQGLFFRSVDEKEK